MRLYTSGRAPNPRRVSIFLKEKGIEIADIVDLDIGKKEQRGETFTALNPFQRLPVLLLDDGTALSESVAICRYIEEELAPEPNLLGATPKERAIVEMWNRRAELTLFAQTSFAFRHLHPSMVELEVPQIAAWGEANKQKLPATLGLFDQALAKTRFLAGERFTIADITAFVAIDFLRPLRFPVPEELSALHRWRADIAARPSIAPIK